MSSVAVEYENYQYVNLVYLKPFKKGQPSAQPLSLSHLKRKDGLGEQKPERLKYNLYFWNLKVLGRGIYVLEASLDWLQIHRKVFKTFRMHCWCISIFFTWIEIAAYSDIWELLEKAGIVCESLQRYKNLDCPCAFIIISMGCFWGLERIIWREERAHHF